MMGKNQVLTAGMQIETFAQFLHRHDRAFNVPPRAALTNLALPRCFAWFGGLPKSEVTRAVFLVLVNVDARSVFHARKIFFRKLPVIGELCDPEIVRAIIG